MRKLASLRNRFTFLRSVLLTIALPLSLAAQSAKVSGAVVDSAKAPLSGVRILIVGTTFSAVTDGSGRFSIGGVTAGAYDLRAQRIGYRPVTIPIVLHDGEEATVAVTLSAAPIQLAGIVVSASRRSEKITEAPATVTRITASEIENAAGNSFGPALKQVEGLDFIQTGVMSVAVNARGFNSAFNNRVLQLEDGRIATLPESGLPLGSLTTIPKIDIAAVEVLVGPGSALYGPDASSGVLSLTTKDPREFPGTTLEAAGGNRSYRDIQGRQAGVFAQNWGYKITAEYAAANDFSNHDVYAPISGTTPSPEIGADFNTNIARGEGALVYYFNGEGGRLEADAGLSKTNTIGLTNVGRNQIVDWKYGHGQLRYANKNWFAQAYHVESRSGDTYQLNGFAQNRLRFPSISDDSVKALSAFPDKANFSAAEVQNTFSLGALNGTRFTYGAQYRHDDVSSMRRWLLDRQTGEDVTIDQKGAYAQVDAPVRSWLKFVGAVRYDKHDLYSGQWSPKAGILISPTPDQTIRVTYNRAFKSPSILQTSFFFPDFQPFVGVFGNRDGFLIKNRDGDVVNTIAPIKPETNTTWELGYKGVLASKVYLDVVGYYSRFDDFQSPLVVIANFTTPDSLGGPTFAFNARTGAAITGATGGPQIPLTYFNVGQATLHGADIGLRYLLTPLIDLNGTASFQKVDKIERRPTDPVEATAFNAPTVKATIGMDFREVFTPKLRLGWVSRFVNSYTFISGVNNGTIPTFGTLDASIGYQLPNLGTNSTLNLSVQNLFACTGGTTQANQWIASGRPAIYTPGTSCGFGHKHGELINSPEIGPIVVLALRFQR